MILSQFPQASVVILKSYPAFFDKVVTLAVLCLKCLADLYSICQPEVMCLILIALVSGLAVKWHANEAFGSF